MKRRALPVVLFALYFLSISSALSGQFSPAGTVQERLTMSSRIMGGNVHYTIYLPPDYETSNRSYPVFYLLHGAGDDDTGWVQLGGIDRIMNKGIANGTLTPMIVVMPDGRRYPERELNTFYTNDADGSVRWGDMFIEEFIPHIERTYRIRPERNVRAIGGLSMGGFGALMFSFQHPDLFSGTIALSAAILTEQQLEALPTLYYTSWFSKSLGDVKGKDRVNDKFRASNPIYLASQLPAAELEKLKLFIDCGAEDELDFDVGNFELHRILREKGIQHRFIMRTGTHNWPYWRKGLEKGLRYISSIYED